MKTSLLRVWRTLGTRFSGEWPFSPFFSDLARDKCQISFRQMEMHRNTIGVNILSPLFRPWLHSSSWNPIEYYCVEFGDQPLQVAGGLWRLCGGSPGVKISSK